MVYLYRDEYVIDRILKTCNDLIKEYKGEKK